MGSSFSNQILTLGFDKTFSGGSILKSVLCKTKHAHEQPHTPVTRIFGAVVRRVQSTQRSVVAVSGFKMHRRSSVTEAGGGCPEAVPGNGRTWERLSSC